MKIGYFNDGPLLPIKEGGAEKIMNLIRFQNITSISEVILFECERPWTSSTLLAKEDFKSIILPDSIFYKDTEQLNCILNTLKIEACIFTNPETLLTVGTRLKSFNQKIIYDCHNVYSIFAYRTGKSKQKVDLIEFMEFAVGKIADLILPCSEIDLEYLVKLGVPRNKMKIIENGVNTKEIAYVGPNFRTNTILFLGNIYYQPNLNAVHKIYNHCFQSHILKDFQFLVAGAVPKEIVDKYQTKRFTFSGYVPDLNEIFKNVTIALAPLSEASGTRLKILNYLSAGIPTISSEIGIEGLKLSDEEIYINNDIKEYPRIISQIMIGSDYKNRIKKGRKKVEKVYDWKAISNKAVHYYAELLQDNLN